MPGPAVQWLDEHTGTTDDTHVLGPDAVTQRGFLMGIMITATGAAGAGVITIYDTKLATAAGAFAAEPVIFGPIEVDSDDAPFLIDLSLLRRAFANGLGIDLDQTDLGVQLAWAS